MHAAALRCDTAFRVDCSIAVAPRSRQKRGQPNKHHAGELPKTPNQFVIEPIYRWLGCVLFLWQRIGSREYMIRTEAEINGKHLLEAPQQQAGSRQQHQRDGDFTSNQRAAKPHMPSAHRASPILKRLADTCPQGGEGW